MRRGVAVWMTVAGTSLLGALPTGSIASAAGASTDQRFVAAVEGLDGAFVGLSGRADALSFHRGTSPEPTLCKHYQGVARKDGADGTPYLVISKSGERSVCINEEGEDGYLIGVRMASRDKTGERLRRNLYPYDGSRAPDADREIWSIALDGRDGWPSYQHPGGMQIVDDVLAIGVENPSRDETVRATILFVDLSDPENPSLITRFDPPGLDGAVNADFGADPVGLTAIRAPDGACCRYLLVSAGGPDPDVDDGVGNGEVRFYRSLPNHPDGNTTILKSPDLDWEEVRRYTEAQIESCNPGFNWPTGIPTQHQSLNFVREGDLDGKLYILGGWRDGSVANPAADEDEYIDLWRVHLGPGGVPAPCAFDFVNQKRVGLAGAGPALQSWGDFTDVGSFAAGSGVHVSPSGEMITYVTDHRMTLFGEYRQRSLVRPNSPTLRPTAAVDGPFAVDEGSTVQLTGQGEAPITKAFVQLFDGHRAGISLTGARLNVEYDDRNRDAFDDLCKLNLGDNDVFDPCGDTAPDPLWDNVSSLRWFAPPGCNIQANDFPIRSDTFPGESTVILRGTGQVEVVDDLSQLRVSRPPAGTQPPWPVSPPAGDTSEDYDYDNDIEGVTFYEAYRADDAVVRRFGCDDYYNASFTLGWDLNRDGTFETSGSPVSFDAASLDGPSTAIVQARGTHPTDTSGLATGASVPVPIDVRNVAPSISSAAITDSLGRDLAGGANVAIAGLPVRLAVEFTDPGRADTQTALVDWGDGTVESTFDSFTDARNGATGALRDTHAFSVAGTQHITAAITDDDGGATSVVLTVQVLSLEQAIQSVVDRIDQLIASALDTRVAASLRAARDELIGNHGGHPPTNGALDKLEEDDPVGAITKLKAAISYLISAESQGAGDLSSVNDLLGLVAEGIATGAYHEAQTAVSPPNRGQERTLRTIAALIAAGHEQLSRREYLEACDSFRQATTTALELLE